MEWYEPEVRMLERRRRLDPGAEGSVVFYGSSSIRLWDSLKEDLGEPQIRNLGFGGSTLEACARFFERLVVPYRPRSLVVYAGDNDLGDGQSPEQVLGSFRSLSRQVGEHLGPIPFAFLSIKPSLARWPIVDAIRSANALIAAEPRPAGFRYVDVFGPMLGPDGFPRPELYADDGLHMTRAGYQVWAEVLLPVVSREFHDIFKTPG